MRLAITAAGKLKDAGLRGLVGEYVKRSSRLSPIAIEHVRDLSAVRERLAQGGGPTVVLDECGKTPDTRELASWLGAWRDQSVREVRFFIGAADGFEQADRDAADRVLSLSRLTLPHRLALLVLTEQLYRASSLLAGHPYHRD